MRAENFNSVFAIHHSSLKEGADRLADLVNKGHQTAHDRRSIHSYFCTREQPQQIDQKKYITEETLERTGDEGRHILDV